MVLDLLRGRRRVGPMVNLAAAGAATAAVILGLAAGLNGVQTVKIKRLKIRNNNAGNTFVHIGTGAGAGFVHLIPPLWSISNTTDDYGEYDLLQTETILAVTAYPDAVGAGSFDVQIECEEIQ